MTATMTFIICDQKCLFELENITIRSETLQIQLCLIRMEGVNWEHENLPVQI